MKRTFSGSPLPRNSSQPRKSVSTTAKWGGLFTPGGGGGQGQDAFQAAHPVLFFVLAQQLAQVRRQLLLPGRDGRRRGPGEGHRLAGQQLADADGREAAEGQRHLGGFLQAAQVVQEDVPL